MQKLPLLLLLLGLLAWGCRRDELINKIIVEEEDPTILVLSSFKGKVLNEDGTPVSGATVRIYNAQTSTNAQGQFIFNRIEAPKNAALVSVEKNGYFLGASMAGSSADGKHYVRITLQKKGTAQSLPASTGGDIQWPNGMKTTLKPNSVQKLDGSAYAGTVQVYSKWLDPTNPGLAGIMPGALMAKDAEGKERVLATYGMVALELETASGEILKIKDGQPVEVDIPIPPALGPQAPTDIPLWYFDLEEERWLLKGSCHNTGGGSYHFSLPATGYWNCDIALEPICLSGTIFQNDSTPAYYSKVIVEDLTDNFIYWGYTDIQGFFCGSVPKGAPLRITIEDLCGNVIYTADIGPYDQNTDLGDIYLNNNLQEYFIHVSGQLLDCAGGPVSLGQVAVQYPGKIRLFPLIAPGVIDFSMALHCIEFPELEITGYDLLAFKATPVQLFSDSTEIVLGNLSACVDPADYFRLTVGSTLYAASPTRFYKKDNVTTNWMILEALTTGGNFVLDLRTYQGVGVYNTNVLFNLNDKPDAPVYPVLNAASPGITVNITEDDGQYISGTMDGTGYDLFGQPQILSGNFKVKKEL